MGREAMQQPRTTVVIVTYRSRKIIGDTLDGVKRCYDAGLVECIVVDNQSLDGTVEFITEEYPWVTVVEPGDNIGFGRGCNLGMAHATTPFVLFLNPDAVIEPSELAKLHDFLDEHPKAGIVAPVTELGSGVYQPIRELPDPILMLKEAARLRCSSARSVAVVPGQDDMKSEWLCGAILLGRRELLEELGGFDPRFFLYFEETDLCVRVVEAGYELWTVGDSTARHIGNASADEAGEALHSSCVARHYFQSRFYYLVKHHGWPLAVVAELGEVVLSGLRGAIGLLRGRKPKDFLNRISLPVLSQPAISTDQPARRIHAKRDTELAVEVESVG